MIPALNLRRPLLAACILATAGLVSACTADAPPVTTTTEHTTTTTTAPAAMPVAPPPAETTTTTSSHTETPSP